MLFNRTIKENILYGKLDADNAKIRKVCEMANALAFIESNIEDLDKEKRAQKIKKDLTSEIETICASHPSFLAIKQALLSKSDDILELLLQVFTKSDAKAMALLASDPQSLLSQLEENEANLGKGMRWDELVLRIEWKCEIETLLKRNDIS